MYETEHDHHHHNRWQYLDLRCRLLQRSITGTDGRRDQTGPRLVANHQEKQSCIERIRLGVSFSWFATMAFTSCNQTISGDFPWTGTSGSTPKPRSSCPNLPKSPWPIYPLIPISWLSAKPTSSWLWTKWSTIWTTPASSPSSLNASTPSGTSITFPSSARTRSVQDKKKTTATTNTTYKWKRLFNFGLWLMTYEQETLRIFYKVLEEQMGGELSAETKAAWVKGMDYAFTFLKMRPSQTHLNSQLSVDDITLVRKFHAAHRHNPAIATRALMKYAYIFHQILLVIELYSNGIALQWNYIAMELYCNWIVLQLNCTAIERC